MVILGGWVFLMSEVPLYTLTSSATSRCPEEGPFVRIRPEVGVCRTMKPEPKPHSPNPKPQTPSRASGDLFGDGAVDRERVLY